MWIAINETRACTKALELRLFTRKAALCVTVQHPTRRECNDLQKKKKAAEEQNTITYNSCKGIQFEKESRRDAAKRNRARAQSPLIDGSLNASAQQTCDVKACAHTQRKAVNKQWQIRNFRSPNQQ